MFKQALSYLRKSLEDRQLLNRYEFMSNPTPDVLKYMIDANKDILNYNEPCQIISLRNDLDIENLAQLHIVDSIIRNILREYINDKSKSCSVYDDKSSIAIQVVRDVFEQLYQALKRFINDNIWTQHNVGYKSLDNTFTIFYNLVRLSGQGRYGVSLRSVNQNNELIVEVIFTLKDIVDIENHNPFLTDVNVSNCIHKFIDITIEDCYKNN